MITTNSILFLLIIVVVFFIVTDALSVMLQKLGMAIIKFVDWNNQKRD